MNILYIIHCIKYQKGQSKETGRENNYFYFISNASQTTLFDPVMFTQRKNWNNRLERFELERGVSLLGFEGLLGGLQFKSV